MIDENKSPKKKPSTKSSSKSTWTDYIPFKGLFYPD